MVHSAQTVHLSCVKISTISKWTESSFHLSLAPRSTIRGVQNDFEPMVRLAQIVHLSYIDTNIVSKQSKMTLHTTHVTLDFHRMRPKWFLSLCYVWRKSSTYVASRIAPMFSENRAPILRQDKHYLQTESNEHPHEPHHLGVPSCVSRMISKPMVRLAQTMHLSYSNTKTTSPSSCLRPKGLCNCTTARIAQTASYETS
jgi:hypothetical protein